MDTFTRKASSEIISRVATADKNTRNVDDAIWAIERKTKRSLLQLRLGCEDLLGNDPDTPRPWLEHRLGLLLAN
jgi:hypothetical protein